VDKPHPTLNQINRFHDFHPRSAALPHNGAGERRRQGMEEPRQERMLRQVIALLLLFAGIAERTAGRALPARILVLLLLGRAEAVARNYAAGMLLVDAICYEEDGMAGPPGLAALALRFRALAAALVTLIEPPGLPRGRHDGRRAEQRRLAQAGRAAAAARRAASFLASPRPCDTS
jgi:hypothetical protein